MACLTIKWAHSSNFGLRFLCISSALLLDGSRILNSSQAFRHSHHAHQEEGSVYEVSSESNLQDYFSLQHHSYLTWGVQILLMGVTGCLHWNIASSAVWDISSWGVRIGGVGWFVRTKEFWTLNWQSNRKRFKEILHFPWKSPGGFLWSNFANIF